MNNTKSPENRISRWYVQFPRALPLAIFLLTSVLTAIAVYGIERSEAERINAQLAETAQTTGQQLERRANATAANLRSASALFASQQDVSADLFRTFVAQLRADSNFVSAESIGWALPMTASAAPAFEAKIRGEGSPSYAIWPKPQGANSKIVPVVYLQPDSPRNRKALGFDLYSEALRRAAIESAQDSGRPTATGQVVLAQDRENPAPGFLIFMPVDRFGRDRRTVSGFVYSPINGQTFLNSAVDRKSLDGFGLRIYDDTLSPENLLAEYKIDDPGNNRAYDFVTIAGKRWQIEVIAPVAAMLSSLSLLTILFGLLVGTLLMVLARVLIRQAVEDRNALVWFEEQASIRSSLTRELNHRVKNTLANVMSIVSLTRRRTADLDSFVESLTGRIRALSATHDLLTQSEWGTTPVRKVIEAELAPYVQTGEQPLDLNGPDVELAPNDALSLGLAMHELATNASKYGALSTDRGKVTVRWQMVTDKLARIDWAESGGPPVAPERTRGFGTDLIEKIVAHELRNPVELTFEPEGVRCTVMVPVRPPAAFSLRAGRQGGSSDRAG